MKIVALTEPESEREAQTDNKQHNSDLKGDFSVFGRSEIGWRRKAETAEACFSTLDCASGSGKPPARTIFKGT
jgi:hypothetical protein